MTPKQLAEQIDARFRALGDPESAASQQRFFRNEISSYGVGTAKVKTIERDVYREIKRWSPIKRNELMNRLWKLGKFEAGTLVCHSYRRFAKQCVLAEFELFENWIDRYVRNWAHTDGVGTWLVAACIRNVPELRHRLVEWTSAENRWKRRAAAVSLIWEAKGGRSLETVFLVADRLLDDRDDMVGKGVGWLLKEAYPKSPTIVMEFLLTRRERAMRLTLRYAAEKMTQTDRKRLLR